MIRKEKDQWINIFQKREEWKTQGSHWFIKMNKHSSWQKSAFLGQITQNPCFCSWNGLLCSLASVTAYLGLWEKIPCPLSPMAPSEKGTEEDGLLGDAWLSQPFLLRQVFTIRSNITMYIPVQVLLWISETIFHQLVGKDQKLWQCIVLAKLSRQTRIYADRSTN